MAIRPLRRLCGAHGHDLGVVTTGWSGNDDGKVTDRGVRLPHRGKGRGWLSRPARRGYRYRGRHCEPARPRRPPTGITIRIVGLAAALSHIPGHELEIRPLYPLCAAIGSDLVVLTTESGNNDAKVADRRARFPHRGKASGDWRLSSDVFGQRQPLWTPGATETAEEPDRGIPSAIAACGISGVATRAGSRPR
jgi:hypothetical protein